jgi:hypothetical protein
MDEPTTDPPRTRPRASLPRRAVIGGVIGLVVIGFAIGHNYASDEPEDPVPPTPEQAAALSPKTPHVAGFPVGIPRVNQPPGPIMLIGDSDMLFAGPYIQIELSRIGVTPTLLTDTSIAGSGIGNPFRYDWLGELPELLALYRPKIVVAHFYGNFATPEQNIARAKQAIDLIRRAGAEPMWVIPAAPDVGGPNAKDYPRTAKLFRELPARQCDWRAALTPTDQWSKYAIFPDGTVHDLWIDGAHLNDEGNRLVATLTAACLRPLLGP